MSGQRDEALESSINQYILKQRGAIVKVPIKTYVLGKRENAEF